MGRAVGGRFPCPTQDPRLEPGRQHARLRPAMPTAQTADAIGLITGFPGCDGLRRAIDQLADRRVGVAVGQQQHNPRTARFVGAAATRTRQRFELGAFVVRQMQWNGSKHATYYHSIND